METIRKRLDDIKTELARHDLKRRELQDNLNLREKRAEYELKKKQHAEKTEQMNLKGVNLDLKSFNQEQKKCEMKRNELRQEINQISISENQLDGRIQAIREEMGLENHKDAVHKYFMCLADLKVLEIR